VSSVTERPATAYQHLLFEREGPLAIITLNRPQRRNALSLELMQELITAFTEIGNNRAIHAVILAATGKVFCSGLDRNTSA
jgi:enoyl-CoA hydratase/carnithine racemase